MNCLKNNRGASAMLLVIAVGTVLAVLILTLQLYVTARSKLVSRIRLAYKYTFVMEDAAKVILNGRLEYLSSGGCPAAGTMVATIASTTLCMPNTAQARCLNGDSCICLAGESDAQCAANYAVYNLKSAEGTMVAFESTESHEMFKAAFDASFLDYLSPDMEEKFVRFMDNIFLRKKEVRGLFAEAVADANGSYSFSANGTPLTTNPVAGTNPFVSPYPNPNDTAFTFRDCGNNRCIEIRVCVSNAREPAVGATLGQVCFQQRITRSFLWDHGTEPCLSAACANPGDPDFPAPTNKGTPGCGDCPWRSRF